MQLDSNDIRQLTEIGFLAAARGDLVRAGRIFGALERVRPAQAAVYMGLALAALNAGRPEEALPPLERGLRAVDAADRDLLHALRGLALQLAGRSAEGQRALASAGDHPLARVMRGDLPAAIEGK